MGASSSQFFRPAFADYISFHGPSTAVTTGVSRYFYIELGRQFDDDLWEARPTDRLRATPVAYNLDVPPSSLAGPEHGRVSKKLALPFLLRNCQTARRKKLR